MTNSSLGQTTADLPQVGSDIGGFLTGIAPGLVSFIFMLGIAVGIIGIIGGIVYVVKSSVSKGHGRK